MKQNHKTNSLVIGLGMLVVLMAGCDRKVTARFELINSTNFVLDSVRNIPNGYENNKYITLAVNEKMEYLVDMSGIAKTDGAYQLNYIDKAGLMKTLNFGYYTNGYPLESITQIRVETDTVIFNFDFKEY